MMAPTAPAPAVQVLIVDDSLPFREAMHVLIDATDGFDWIGEASSGQTGIEQAARLGPDLVLMDIRMPGLGGVEAARLMALHPVPTAVVLISCAELPTAAPGDPVVAVLPKDRLNPAVLTRLWREHGSNKNRTEVVLGEADGYSERTGGL